MNMLNSSSYSYFKPCDQTSFLNNVAAGAADGFEVGTFLAALTSTFAALTTRDGLVYRDEYETLHMASLLAKNTVSTAIVTSGLTTALGAAVGASTSLINKAYCYAHEAETTTNTLSNIFNTAVSYLPSKEQAYEYCPDLLCGRDEL
ncbi:MAG: hypothetical protein S4CHLAM6_10870 [Chlamydiae bacterium]|nr:hypothetical protein [Chlamydiota bacterium]